MGSFLYTLLGLSSLLAAEGAVADAVTENESDDGRTIIISVPIDDEESSPTDDSSIAIDGDSVIDVSNIQWAESYGYQCHSFRGHRVCEGPRRVPEPSGPAAALASDLDLGLRSTASSLMIEPPRPEWIQAINGESPEALVWPVEGGELSRGFGYFTRGSRRRLHKGFDINADEGTPIHAIADGIVAYSDNRMRGYGNLLMVIHADETVSVYAHCRAIHVFAGQLVEAGQVVGEVGHTGNAMGPHLHFELRREGRPVDPFTAFDDVPCRWPRYCQALQQYHEQLAQRRAVAENR